MPTCRTAAILRTGQTTEESIFPVRSRVLHLYRRYEDLTAVRNDERDAARCSATSLSRSNARRDREPMHLGLGPNMLVDLEPVGIVEGAAHQRVMMGAF